MIYGSYPARVIRRTVDRDAASDAELREIYTGHRESIERRRVQRGRFVALGSAVYDRVTGARVEIELGN